MFATRHGVAYRKEEATKNAQVALLDRALSSEHAVKPQQIEPKHMASRPLEVQIESDTSMCSLINHSYCVLNLVLV